MDKLKIIDNLNEHKQKKYLSIDKNINVHDYYISYTKKPKQYIKLVNSPKNGKKILDFPNNRPYPIFQGFVDGETSVILVSGPRGSGKSTFGSVIGEDYHKLNPKNKIYLINSTSKNMDQNMKHQKYIQDFDIGDLNNYPILDKKLQSSEITDENKDANIIFETYHDALFIVDDIDNLGNKEVQHRIDNFINLLMELGRKRGISVLKISHFESNGQKTRLLLKEFNYYITFNNSALQTNRILKHYKKTDMNIFHKDETYLIFNFDYDYVITNKRIIMLS